jgi:hypothetical protein
VSFATRFVETVNVADNWPSGTTIVVGRVADKLVEVSLTLLPPIGAGPEMLTVPIVEPPETTGF